VTDDTLGREWVVEAQKLLLSLRDIVGADITLTDGGSALAEINILAEGHRPPKQIVRDVRSALRAEYQVDVDYRKISVAQRREPEREAGETGAGPKVLSLPAPQVGQEPSVERLRFEGVTVSVDHGGSEVRVELGLGRREAVGEAGGASSGRQIPRLVAEATLQAVGKFLEPAYSLVLSEMRILDLADEEIVLVAVRFSQERSELTLTGSCVVAHSLQQSVVYATLAALNRVLGRLRFREPVEYRIRPSSVF